MADPSFDETIDNSPVIFENGSKARLLMNINEHAKYYKSLSLFFLLLFFSARETCSKSMLYWKAKLSRIHFLMAKCFAERLHFPGFIFLMAKCFTGRLNWLNLPHPKFILSNKIDDQWSPTVRPETSVNSASSPHLTLLLLLRTRPQNETAKQTSSRWKT